MTPAELCARIPTVLGPDAGCDLSSGDLTVDVDRSAWVTAAAALRDDPLIDAGTFDLLTAVDEFPDGFRVVLQLWSVAGRHGLALRTSCPREDASVPSLAGVFAGAGWHERATAEMFDIAFPGHPDLAPLLLPDGFDGHPLRKDFALVAREVKAWPGAKEPGESAQDVSSGPPGRRRQQPLGAAPAGRWPRPGEPA